MAWPTSPGSGALTIDGQFKTASGHNIVLGEANIASGQAVLALVGATTAPASLAALAATGGGVMYAQSGHLFWMGSLGTVTNVASA